MLLLTLTCPPPEGILNSISSVLPQAAGAAVSAAAAGGQGSSGPPPMNFTVPSSTGTTHIHVGTMATPETAEPPHMGAYIGEIPFAFPGFPSNIRFGPPHKLIFTLAPLVQVIKPPRETIKERGPPNRVIPIPPELTTPHKGPLELGDPYNLGVIFNLVEPHKQGETSDSGTLNRAKFKWWGFEWRGSQFRSPQGGW